MLEGAGLPALREANDAASASHSETLAKNPCLSTSAQQHIGCMHAKQTSVRQNDFTVSTEYRVCRMSPVKYEE